MGGRKNQEDEVERVLDCFREIAEIPRPSYEEERIADYLESRGKRLGLGVFRDGHNNVILRQGKREAGCPSVILQAHTDMVWETENPQAEREKVPHGIHEEDGYMRASGTTLGADNGIGMALILALLNKGGDYPPLEAVFTSNEEETMEGAEALNGEVLSGEWMINLDSEKEGVFTIGAAGGISVLLEFPVTEEKAGKKEFVTVAVRGGKGGHSGLEIGKKRENAIGLLIRFLRSLDESSWELSALEGGSRSNAIPSEASAVILVEDTILLEKQAALFMEQRLNEWSGEEEELTLNIEKNQDVKERVRYAPSCRERLLLLMENLPHGVKSRTEEFICSSVNLASVRENGGQKRVLTIELSLRSSYESWYKDEAERICRLGKRFGAGSVIKDEYPAWTYKKESKLTGILCEAYRESFGCEPVLENVHAGVECGIIMKNCPSVKEAISIGPTIVGAHTVKEAVEMASVGKIFRLLDAVLTKIKQMEPNRGGNGNEW